MLSATPARRRTSLAQSRPPPSARSRATPRATDAAEAPELPPYEAPEAPLTADTHRQLRSLLQSQYLRVTTSNLQHAAEKLTDSAGEVNERLSDARLRYERLKERRRTSEEDTQEPDGDDDNEEYQRLAEQERRVDAVTGRMEEKIRQLIDGETQLHALTEKLAEIDREEGDAQNAALGARQTRGPRRLRRRGDEDEDEDGEDEEDEDYEATPVREFRERNAQNPPSRRLDDSLVEGQDQWKELSLTERYAGHNTYIGFYRIVHDSKFPGDEVPPLPLSTTWFSHLEDHVASGSPSNRRTRTRTHTQRQPSPADSDDIAIERERISLHCPVTLLRFRDPVTSTKCPHSFERDAIMDMIARSRPMPGGPRRAKAVKCPVCSILLTADDLPRDAALLRRVRRAEELEARRAEDGELEDDGQRQGDRVTLASDALDADEDAMDVDVPTERPIKSEPVRVKAERRQTMELGSDEDEDEDEEEEEEEEEDSE
ncbi:uncharacterized protein N7482_004290 [Penicillium canariense]|uniref:SP-RING-type domain-containing protein n=1 Tax=Penicillium canariense TaxID=189055 RepID=A0A9W9I6C0_9EURO|nr:uncharacterized protein N7482_004290 [Penicillium canariense]KAJ5168696.1 hypothetical protein N7482_004290 [Penicillium canariense]